MYCQASFSRHTTNPSQCWQTPYWQPVRCIARRVLHDILLTHLSVDRPLIDNQWDALPGEFFTTYYKPISVLTDPIMTTSEMHCQASSSRYTNNNNKNRMKTIDQLTSKCLIHCCKTQPMFWGLFLFHGNSARELCTGTLHGGTAGLTSRQVLGKWLDFYTYFRDTSDAISDWIKT